MSELSLLLQLPNRRHLLTLLKPQNHVLGNSVLFWGTSLVGPSKGFRTDPSLRGTEGSRQRKEEKAVFLLKGGHGVSPVAEALRRPLFHREFCFLPQPECR